MKSLTSLFLLALTSSFAAADLTHEHKGDLIRAVHSGNHEWTDSGVINNGSAVGQNVTWGNESVYISYPSYNAHPGIAILYLSDIFGVQLINNRLLADSLAKAGYFVAAPDLFRGDPVPTTAMGGTAPGFNMTAWSLRHPQDQVEAIIENAIKYLQQAFGANKIGAVGYCFGGRYVARFLNGTRGISVGFTAHPSGTLANEWQAIAAPISVAFGALDTLNPPENRSNIEAIFINGNKTFQTSLYANAAHGFGVRITNTSDPLMAFAQEGAYLQAVRWFDYWLA